MPNIIRKISTIHQSLHIENKIMDYNINHEVPIPFTQTTFLVISNHIKIMNDYNIIDLPLITLCSLIVLTKKQLYPKL